MRTGTGIFDTERGFTGQIRDALTGLNFYNARYQDPVLGRFFSPDSIVPNRYVIADLNRFIYVRNRPLIYIDPTGNTCSFFGENDSCDEGDPSLIAPTTVEQGFLPYAATFDIFKNEDVQKTRDRFNDTEEILDLVNNEQVQAGLESLPAYWFEDNIAPIIRDVITTCQTCGSQLGGRSFADLEIDLFLESNGVELRGLSRQERLNTADRILQRADAITSGLSIIAAANATAWTMVQAGGIAAASGGPAGWVAAGVIWTGAGIVWAGGTIVGIVVISN